LKTLLLTKSAVETLVGLALALFPSLLISLLLGSLLDAPAGIVVARMAGSALLAMGIACWLARNNSESRAATGLIMALLFYDAAVVVIFLCARIGAGLWGIGLWPAIILHSGLAVWSVLCLKRVQANVR
jgi:hypothetical protein